MGGVGTIISGRAYNEPLCLWPCTEAMQVHQTAEGSRLTWGWEDEEQEEGKKKSEGTQPWKEKFKWLSADSDATTQY